MPSRTDESSPDSTCCSPEREAQSLGDVGFSKSPPQTKCDHMDETDYVAAIRIGKGHLFFSRSIQTGLQKCHAVAQGSSKIKKEEKKKVVIIIINQKKPICLCFLSSALHSMQRGSRVPGCFTKVQYPCQVKEVLAGHRYTAHTAVTLCWPPESKMLSPYRSFQLHAEVTEHIPPQLCLAVSPKHCQKLFWLLEVAMANLGRKQVKVAAPLDAANKGIGSLPLLCGTANATVTI